MFLCGCKRNVQILKRVIFKCHAFKCKECVLNGGRYDGCTYSQQIPFHLQVVTLQNFTNMFKPGEYSGHWTLHSTVYYVEMLIILGISQARWSNSQRIDSQAVMKHLGFLNIQMYKTDQKACSCSCGHRRFYQTQIVVKITLITGSTITKCGRKRKKDI